jgi:hypothetical protein
MTEEPKEHVPFTSEDIIHVKALSMGILKTVGEFSDDYDITPRTVMATFMFLLENSFLASRMTKAEVSIALQSLLNCYSEEDIEVFDDDQKKEE